MVLCRLKNHSAHLKFKPTATCPIRQSFSIMVHVNVISLAFATQMVLLLAQQSSSFVISGDQRITAVSELREQLGNELTMDFMREDYWLNNWLNHHSFDAQETLQSVRNNLQFRKEQNIAQILNEDWTDLRAKFPYSRNTFDKSGRPILYYDVKEWDSVGFLSSDASAHDKLLRYMQMMHEESEAHVRQLRVEGRDISQYTHIVNIGGFNPAKHASIKCAQMAHDIGQVLAPYTPVNIDRAVLVNVPNVYKMIHSMMTTDAQSKYELYGQDQSQWENTLLEFIDRDQLPPGILDEVVKKDNTDGILMWNKEL